MNHPIHPLSVLLAALWLPMAPAAERIELSAQQIENAGIELGLVQKAQTVPLFTAPARIAIPPSHEFIVSAPQEGLVSKVEAAEGDSVAAGQALAYLNSPELLALQRSLLDAASGLNLARAKYRRDQTLFQEGIIAERRLQETRSEYNLHTTALNQARQLLEIAGMEAKDIDALLHTRRLGSLLAVRAPVEGTVLEKMVVAGQRVDLLAPLFRVASLDTLWLEIDAPQERAHWVSVGDQVAIDRSDARARVILIGKSVHPRSQTVLVRAAVEGAAGALIPGQTVSASLVRDTDAPTFKVPPSAQARMGGASWIFVRTPEGFEARKVDIVGSDETHAVVSGKLTADERIAVSGVVVLKAILVGLGDDD